MIPENVGTHPSPARYVLPETTFLAVLGSVDLLTTVYLLATNQAREANPLMAACLVQFGPWGFVLFKALFLGAPLAIAEMARLRHPVFVRSCLRMAVILYVGLYAISFAHSNIASSLP